MAEQTGFAVLFPIEKKRLTGWRILGGLAVVLFLAFLILPLASLFLQAPFSDLVHRLRSNIVWEALRLSLITSLISLFVTVAMGLPVAFFLATREFKGKRALEALINLPMVLPPTVAGLGLLLALGRNSPLGRLLGMVGVTLPFSTAAVVLAQIFVAAPFFVNTARAGFESIELRYLQAAATLRATPMYTFSRVMIPLSLASLGTGAAMSWARALGEFGATITFAGNMPGVTQTMPLAVYMAMQSDLGAAIVLSLILVVVSFGLLYFLRGLAIGRRVSSRL
jgi:molybdate transport system permease protein